MLLVLDSRPFEDLHHIVEDFQDDRIWVFAEWVRAGMPLLPDGTASMRSWCCRRPGVQRWQAVNDRPYSLAVAVAAAALSPVPALPCLQIDQQFKPKEGVEWAPGYHGTLYNLTDDAIQVRVGGRLDGPLGGWLDDGWMGAPLEPSRRTDFVAQAMKQPRCLPPDSAAACAPPYPLATPASPLQVCPPGSKWLVVTNGDNEYGEDFMQRVRGSFQLLPEPDAKRKFRQESRVLPRALSDMWLTPCCCRLDCCSPRPAAACDCLPSRWWRPAKTPT